MKPMRLHHVGIVLPTLEKAHEFMQNNGLEIDYAGYVDAYQADLIFTKFGEFASPIEMIIPHSGVLTQFNGGRGGIAHIAFEVDDVEAVRQEMEADCPGCMLEKKAVQGTDDIIVNFRRPTTNQGILVEYVQTTAPITGRGENPFVKNLGPEKGKLNETWHPMRLHHIGIVLPTLEKAHEFIKTNGLEVDDVEKVRQIMESQKPGCMLEKKAVRGTDDIIVNFRRPSTDAGILVEYVQTVAPINRSNPNPFND